ncbi:hypothetical protein CYMTET_17318 [Cymbomonas tetramitiformis]|uniref:Uncharacterized protein n=1 Tax=Cymbomonas tetramitiformis TaxID=36881 RepID=A0AAE0ESE0_9CHLO|nr:hypothetical protein CYMTET_51691 [Cymbomonas tetramitiformis]KAK3274508.1 hypothetical protein CYMTET_17318 [Cymbomonas tetramitiformis]
MRTLSPITFGQETAAVGNGVCAIDTIAESNNSGCANTGGTPDNTVPGPAMGKGCGTKLPISGIEEANGTGDIGLGVAGPGSGSSARLARERGSALWRSSGPSGAAPFFAPRADAGNSGALRFVGGGKLCSALSQRTSHAPVE